MVGGLLMRSPQQVGTVTLYQCPVCRDRPTLGPVSRGAWSCLSGHSEVDAVPIDYVPALVASRLAEALEKLDEAGWDDFETIEFARARLAEFTGEEPS